MEGELSWVTSKSGNRIAVRTAGTNGPPVVLLHGWAQTGRCWPQELAMGCRCLAVDLRGHGDSEDAGEYADSAAWAADLAAVLDTLDEPAVLVGWSYGGLAITDYIRHFGTSGVRGLLLTGAITEIGKDRPGGRIGAVMREAIPDALSTDPATAVPALARFVEGLTVRPVRGALHQALLGAALNVDPHVRAALFARTVDSREVLAGIDVPAVLVHGAQDAVVAPSTTEYAASLIPGAQTHIWPDVGHLPFLERAQEFHTILARLLAL
ncbi:alpha/beta fold hydrolase [Sciscionella sediminilitoris]|uniref:alpha/beta fold hydrolase n=1 Tax=Sciscionella sediminilitoris TaxID=1445613 RepID=UPI0009ECA93A|nr:alpha/beta hydrolase [Sciscionella sp. SE31]